METAMTRRIRPRARLLPAPSAAYVPVSPSIDRGSAPFLRLLFTLLLAFAATAAPATAAPACSDLAPALAAGARALPAAETPGAEAFAAYLTAAREAAREGGGTLGVRLAALSPGHAVPEGAAGAASCVLRGYVQARYGEALIRDLREMVAFQTFAVEGRENWGAPEFLRQRDWLAARAAALGLAFRDFDGRVEEVTLAGPAPILAVLTHGDVQGVEGQEWSSPPWEARLVGERIVGRGTEDDKGPIVATLYALAALRDTGWPLDRSVKLLVANGEESSWDEIPYYLERAPMPETTFGIDAAYPVTHAQKGFGVLTFRTGAPTAEPQAGPAPGRWRVEKIAGGSGLSIIPERGEAWLEPVGEPAGPERLGELARAAGAWVAQNPPANLTVTREGEGFKIEALGRGGHSSEPASGHNALGDLAAFLATLELQPDAWGGLVELIGEQVGTETDGRSLGIAHRDEVMGALTSNLAFFEEAEGAPQARVNVRVPRGIPLEQIRQRLAERTRAFAERSGVPVTAEAALLSEPHVVPVEGRLVSTLLKVWEDVTGTPGRPIAIGGGTQARLFAGGVDFGPASGMEHYRGHGTDEYLTVPELKRIAELTVAALWELAR